MELLGRDSQGSVGFQPANTITPFTAGAGITVSGTTIHNPTVIKGVATAITTVGAGTLTAAAMANGLIARSGPTAAYNDTTDTATAILATMTSPRIGDGFEFTIQNGVAYAGTMVAGSGITLAGVTANAASKVREYRATVTAVTTPAVTITGIGEMVA